LEYALILPNSHIKEEPFGIILAAGQGKRMQTNLPKVAHTILGKSLVEWCIETFEKANISNLVVVLSPKQQEVIKIIQNHELFKLKKLHYCFQEEALGTGNAALCGLKKVQELKEFSENSPVIIGFGDTPALRPESLKNGFNFHLFQKNTCTVLGFETENPTGYGRIVLNVKNSEFIKIQEEKDCNELEKKITLVNSGFLICVAKQLLSYLPNLTNNNSNKEYYLTDIPQIAEKNKYKVGVYKNLPEAELLGVNTQEQLAYVAKLMQERILSQLMTQGVQILNPKLVYIEPSISFGKNCIVEPFVYLSGNKKYSDNTRIVSFTKV
jgi:bifunctional UDP-N-acetylglucosamine pyrophosphorylase / glucosamine-1-phosphate N-acetyltransferase